MVKKKVDFCVIVILYRIQVAERLIIIFDFGKKKKKTLPKAISVICTVFVLLRGNNILKGLVLWKNVQFFCF